MNGRDHVRVQHGRANAHGRRGHASGHHVNARAHGRGRAGGGDDLLRYLLCCLAPRLSLNSTNSHHARSSKPIQEAKALRYVF